jgi:hypothetical protein
METISAYHAESKLPHMLIDIQVMRLEDRWETRQCHPSANRPSSKCAPFSFLLRVSTARNMEAIDVLMA